jgi:hypothetical protein
MRSQPPSYHGYRFPPEIISHAVWLYHRFCLSFRDAGRSTGPARCDGHLRDDSAVVSNLRAGVCPNAAAPRGRWATRGTWTNCSSTSTGASNSATSPVSVVAAPRRAGGERDESYRCERAPDGCGASFLLRSPWAVLILLPLFLLFLFLHLLLLAFFLVFLATLVSHARSCSVSMTRDGELSAMSESPRGSLYATEGRMTRLRQPGKRWSNALPRHRRD